MPRILRILNRLNLGGPTTNAAYLSKYVPEPFETLLVAGKREHHESGSDHILERLGVHAERIPSMVRTINPHADMRAYRALRRLIRDYRPDIVHTHASKAGALGRLAAKSMRVPIILHTFHGHWFHSYFSPVRTRVLIEVERRLSQMSTAVVAISPSQAQDLTETYRVVPKKKIRVVPLGIDVERFQQDGPTLGAAFRQEHHIPANHVVVAHVGRLVPIKNQARLLRVFAAVRARTSVPVTLCVVGDGPELGNLMALAQELELPFRQRTEKGTEPLVFTSWIQNVERVHAASDIGILTSLNEGTPLSLIEAQAAGRPVVSTDVGGVRDCMLAEETGFLAPAGNDDTLVAHLSRLVEDESLRRSMGKRAQSFAEERFHYRRLVKDMTALYSELIEARSARTP